jgi:hypothetical protein
MDEIMRPEYDFSKAKRGKHYRPLHHGYRVQVEQADGTSTQTQPNQSKTSG